MTRERAEKFVESIFDTNTLTDGWEKIIIKTVEKAFKEQMRIDAEIAQKSWFVGSESQLLQDKFKISKAILTQDEEKK